MRLLSLTLLLGLGAAPLAAQSSQPPAAETPQPVAASTPVRGFGPDGATLRCRDGSYPAPGAADSACDGKGGVLVRFPRRLDPPQRAADAASRAPSAPPLRLRQVPPRDTLPPEGFVPYEELRRRAQRRNDAARRIPEGATLLCKDGTFIVRDTTAARCQFHGGVNLRLEAERSPNR